MLGPTQMVLSFVWAKGGMLHQVCMATSSVLICDFIGYWHTDHIGENLPEGWAH